MRQMMRSDQDVRKEKWKDEVAQRRRGLSLGRVVLQEMEEKKHKKMREVGGEMCLSQPE